MTPFVFAYIPCKDQEEALSIGKQCVSQKIAACGNILPGMMSVYEWEGKIRTETECLLLLKTTQAQQHDVTETVQSLHSYDLPCIVFLPIESGHDPYLRWIDEQTLRP